MKKQNISCSVVRGFSLVHDPEGSHYKNKVCLAMTCLFVIVSPFLLSLRAFSTCHCEPFASCHSERSEESQDAQDRLREAISSGC